MIGSIKVNIFKLPWCTFETWCILAYFCHQDAKALRDTKNLLLIVGILLINMIKRFHLLLDLIFAFLIIQPVISQTGDSSSFRLVTRQSFYSFEKSGEFLLNIPAGLTLNNLTIDITAAGKSLLTWEGIPGKNILRLPFILDLEPAVYKTTASIKISARPQYEYHSLTDLNILQYKSNEVKSDRLTGGLIVNKRQFFPFGFYCYSPVYPTLPEEEVVKGFNMISPYQKIMPQTLSERKAYMDRCAQLGMKVNYNLLSVSGGGGVGSKIDSITDEEKRKRLISEIEMFRDHPALLGWYISDEPNGRKIAPEIIEEIYRTVKSIDPWHPVSIVITAPFLTSKKYGNGTDIMMADPYPLPDLPPSFVGEITKQLKKEFTFKNPLWIVPQAFGGGEIWTREPTIQEIRTMTWQAIINGATGIQYFVRQGPNYFPKSASTWSECGRIAMEVAELTPWLLSDEETYPVETYSDKISISSKLHNGQLIVMAVNRTNEPVASTIRIRGVSNAKARVIFENRVLSVIDGVISDHLSPYGSQVYLINIRQEPTPAFQTAINLMKDPGFEDLSSPGIPSACYARPGGDRGATFFLDTREHFSGNHSVRIITPQEDKSLALRFFPIQVKAGSTYTISLWAKSDPEQRTFFATKEQNDRLYGKKEMPQYAEILLGEFGRARFVPEKEWKRFVTFITIPTDTLASFRTNLILKMPGQGVGWFDEIKVSEEIQK